MRDEHREQTKVPGRKAGDRFPPRDGKGRFVSVWDATDPKDRHIIVVDEFGNTGPSHRGETKFGFGVSEVRHPRAYVAISHLQRKLHRTDEWKAHDASIAERTATAVMIRATGTKTSCVYVDKDGDIPKGMRERDTKRRVKGMLGYTLDDTLPKSGAVWVVVDKSNSYGNDRTVEKICKDRSNRIRHVCGGQYNSSDNSDKHKIPSSLIQTNDYVTNAARSKTESGMGFRSKVLKTRFRKADSKTMFKERDMESYPKNRVRNKTR